MRFPLIFALIFPFFFALGTVGQEKQEHQVEIACPTLGPKIVKQVQPIYPKEAKQSGIEGKVSLWCVIGSDGSVEEIRVVKGEEPFAQAAKTAVAQWKYEPIKLNGVAVQSDTTVDVIFQIPRQKSKRSKSPGAHSAPQG